MAANRLTQKNLKKYRTEQLEAQDYTCALCGYEILLEEAVLDHCHNTGKVRRVLHRSCNQTEGRILSWINRCRSDDPLTFVKNLVDYWEADYNLNPEHPSHLSELCKRFKRKNKTEQIEILNEHNVQLNGSEKKSDLVKLYRKAIK